MSKRNAIHIEIGTKVVLLAMYDQVTLKINK